MKKILKKNYYIYGDELNDSVEEFSAWGNVVWNSEKWNPYEESLVNYMLRTYPNQTIGITEPTIS